MVNLFVPGLYVCLLLSAVISLVVAYFIIWLILNLIVEMERISLQAVLMIVFVGLGGLYGAVAGVYGGWKAMEKATIPSRSIPILPGQIPNLRTMLADLSRSMNTQIPDNILVEFGVSFFVTQANVV